MSEDLKVLFPDQDLVLTIDGKKEVVTVKPFKVGQLMKAMKPISELIQLVGGTSTDNEFIIRVITEGGDKLTEIVKIATGKDAAWFESLDLDQAVEVITLILAQNKDHFEKKVGPALNKTKVLFQKETVTGDQSIQG